MRGGSYSREYRKPIRNTGLDLHQCKQCGIVYRAITKPVFSWDKKFMIDKCKACIEFGYRSLFSGVSI
jgi:hypothetical protein